MNKTSYTNLAKGWEFAEDHAFSRQPKGLVDARTRAEESGLPQGSSAQSALLALLVRMTRSSSVIMVGTGSIVETLELIRGLDNGGQLTAVDSSAQGIVLIRSLFTDLADRTQTRLRAVNAQAGVFLPRLNGDDYDLIVVAGDAANYAATFAQAPRLLRSHGLIVFTDVFALAGEHENGGLLNPADRGEKAVMMRGFIDDVESDEAFDTAMTPTGTGLLIAMKR